MLKGPCFFPSMICKTIKTIFINPISKQCGRYFFQYPRFLLLTFLFFTAFLKSGLIAETSDLKDERARAIASSSNRSLKGTAPEAVSPPAKLSDIKSPSISSNSSYKKAVEFYKSGDIQGAIAGLGEFLKSNPQHAKAKEILVEVLVVASVESYLLGKEDESLEYLTRAMDTAPNVETVNRLYEKIKKNRFGGSSEKQPAVGSLPVDAQAFQSVVKELAQGQKDLLTTTQNSLNKIIQSSEDKNKKVLDSLNARESLLIKEIKHGRYYSAWVILGGVSILLLLVAIILYVIQRIVARREKLLMDQGEKFFQMMQEHSGKVLEHMTTISTQGQLTSGYSAGSPALLEHNTAEKMRKIDIIDAEIVKEGSETLRTDAKVMAALLEDSDPEVRARAIQVLLKYDTDEAYRRIQNMLASAHTGTRILAIKVLSGIATAKSVEILIQLLMKDGDVAVKRQSITALRSLSNENLDEETKGRIDFALSHAMQTEGWIVK